MINRLGATRFGVWMIKHLAAPLQRWLYRLTSGKVIGWGHRNRNILLLTTIGRRTGKERTTPVFFLQDGDHFILCNVNPGFEQTNPWVLNLRAHPLAKIQIGQKHLVCQAREANQAEVFHYWPQLLKLWPAYADHFRRSGQRTIFILSAVPSK